MIDICFLTDWFFSGLLPAHLQICPSENMKILVLNAGSSSIKYSLFDMSGEHVRIAGIIEKIGEPGSLHRINFNGPRHEAQCITQSIDNHRQGLNAVFNILTRSGAIDDKQGLFCISHRVVHGGEHFHKPVLIDKKIQQTIRDLIPLAPLHNPANLQGIELALNLQPEVPQVAVFDTAFHQTLPNHAYRYAIPSTWYQDDAVRRYGFHGTSHHYVAKRAAEYLKKPLSELNLISLHLGNGASITAIEKGQSIDTSMGMTPLEGLIMGSRCGDIDPAIPFYISRKKKLTQADLETLLNTDSGLKGLCGENDMRAVQRLAETGNREAQLALQMYVYRIKKYLGAYFAILGRVDAIIFTGGIGENDCQLREQCCAGLSFLGITVNTSKNSPHPTDCFDISSDNPQVVLLVIKTNEALEIARQSVHCVIENREDPRPDSH